MSCQLIFKKARTVKVNKTKEPIKKIKDKLLGLVPTPNLIKW